MVEFTPALRAHLGQRARRARPAGAGVDLPGHGRSDRRSDRNYGPWENALAVAEVMEQRGWLHAYDADGRFIGPERLPQHVKDMGDDIYRSLSGAVRNAGGYGKTEVPFAEFKWADFFRSRITRSLAMKDFDSAVKQAMRLAVGSDAAALPLDAK